jgi:hypothetical protein
MSSKVMRATSCMWPHISSYRYHTTMYFIHVSNMSTFIYYRKSSIITRKERSITDTLRLILAYCRHAFLRHRTPYLCSMLYIFPKTYTFECDCRVITVFTVFGCWLILSVYILMSFDFPFVRFLWVRGFFFYYPYLSFFELRILITTFVSSHSSIYYVQMTKDGIDILIWFNFDICFTVMS